jgi:hypothetical protein
MVRHRARRSLRLPSVYPLRDYAEASGLLSHGPVISDNFKRAAVLVDKILRGDSAADLPFERPTHFELMVNLKTAQSLTKKPTSPGHRQPSTAFETPNGRSTFAAGAALHAPKPTFEDQKTVEAGSDKKSLV